METIEYRTTDKSGWGEGPWQQEPDKKQWQDAVTGYPCLIVRNRGGALCGYVGVATGHPCFGLDYDKVGAEVHGGLTFADRCSPNADESKHICHKTDGDDHVWWLGFDCSHYGDISPAYEMQNRERGERSFGDGYETYKDFRYVTNEVALLAKQLKAIEVTSAETARD